jgi:hypothetical protein
MADPSNTSVDECWLRMRKSTSIIEEIVLVYVMQVAPHSRKNPFRMQQTGQPYLKPSTRVMTGLPSAPCPKQASPQTSSDSAPSFGRPLPPQTTPCPPHPLSCTSRPTTPSQRRGPTLSLIRLRRRHPARVLASSVRAQAGLAPSSSEQNLLGV